MMLMRDRPECFRWMKFRRHDTGSFISLRLLRSDSPSRLTRAHFAFTYAAKRLMPDATGDAAAPLLTVYSIT